MFHEKNILDDDKIIVDVNKNSLKRNYFSIFYNCLTKNSETNKKYNTA